MSTIYMLKREIRFYGSAPLKTALNKLIQQDVFSFPSNIIQCSLMIADLNMWRGTVDTTGIAKQETGTISLLGAGIEEISCVGTQVYFSAWMQLLRLSDAAENTACLLSGASYLSVQAIAECQ